MKFRLLLLLSLALIPAFCPSTSAGPMGPVRPRPGQFGLELELSSDRTNIERTTIRTPAGAANRAEAFAMLGRLSYGLNSRIELSIRAGAADLDLIDQSINDQDFASQSFPLTTWNGSFNGAWGGGIGAIVLSEPTFNLALNGNFLGHYGHTSSNPFTFFGSNSSPTVDYGEWNAGIQLQVPYRNYSPYFGLKLSNVGIDVDRPEIKFEKREKFGIYFGSGWDISQTWSGYFEGRILDETSFGGGIRYTFGQTPEAREVRANIARQRPQKPMPVEVSQREPERRAWVPPASAAPPAAAPAPERSRAIEQKQAVFLVPFNYISGPPEFSWYSGALEAVFRRNWERAGIMAAAQGPSVVTVEADYAVAGNDAVISVRLLTEEGTIKRLNFRQPTSFDLFKIWTPILDEVNAELRKMGVPVGGSTGSP